MRFLILGPLEVHDGDGVRGVGGIKPRSVLAMLLLRANQPVSAEQLALGLWGQDAPGGATKTVQVNVWRLRTALGNPRLIATTPAGYCLRVGPDELDVVRFERLVKYGRQALVEGQPEQAATTLREALALWRGPPLADLADEPFAQAEIAQLEEQRLAALETRVDADLAAGRHAELVGELRRLVAMHPTRERLTGQLMLALYRGGRQTEALEAYQGTRRALVVDVGVEPGPRLRELQQAILCHDGSLEVRGRVPRSSVEPTALAASPDGRTEKLSRGLLEREKELGRIAAAIANPGQVLVIEGEAGIGKSALLSAGAEMARIAGARVLIARGGSLERDLGHGVTRQLFERPLRTAPTSQRRRWLAGAARLAVPVLGLETTTDAGSGGDPAFAAQHGLYWLASNITADGLLVLVVDDLQWADLASLRWLVYLARRLEDLPVVVLTGWRVGEPQAPQDLLEALSAERVALRPLSVTAAATLVGREIARECDPDTARVCHQATHGNPLFLSQLAQAMEADIELPLEAACIARLGGAAVAPYVHARLRGLPSPAADVAVAAAMLEGEVTPRQLVALTGLELTEVRDACDRLVDSRLLTGRELLEFAHPLVRLAIYDTLSPARRAAAHRAAADMLDAEGLVDRAAVHLIVAERIGDDDVVARLVRAADRATERGAVDEAIVLLSRALEEPPSPTALYGVLMALAHAEWLAGDQAGAEHARWALTLADRPAEREAAALRLVRLLSPLGRQQEAIEILASVAEELKDRAPDCALRLDVERLSWSCMLPRPPRGITQIAASHAARAEPGSVSASILHANVAFAAAKFGEVPAAVSAEMALDALADKRMLKDLGATSQALSTLGYCERLDEYTTWVERRSAAAARSGSRIAFRSLTAHRARIAWLRGDLAAAVSEATQALTGGRKHGFPFYAPSAVATLVSALVEQGELSEAEYVLRCHGFAHGITFAWWRVIPARISLMLAKGAISEAQDDLATAPPERVALPLQLAACEVAVALACGSRNEARERARTMLTAAERFEAPGTLGIARRLVGLTTDEPDDLELLRSAVDSLQLSPRRLELARTLVDYGAALRRQKHRDAAREPLRQGLDLAQRCGATTLTQQAIAELRATGARPRRLPLTGVDSLTPSELRVARLAAQGYSNPQVAQALFVTSSTVDTHLHATFRKLDIRSRDQLSAALQLA